MSERGLGLLCITLLCRRATEGRVELKIGASEAVVDFPEDLVHLSRLTGQQGALGLTHGLDFPPQFVEFRLPRHIVKARPELRRH